ncbi:MAG: AraC family transcriptional regulator [Oscillospiraceae bacterium]|nr:AraC family transcriptional regulator [Oscillospiraceae bacterium]
MDWVKRINAVLDYIEDNLDGEMDDNDIASLFASPQGMFQRIFTNITDITLSEYIRKRRLTQAAQDIRQTNEKIIDIATKYGYDSASAFGCAFKNFHGAAPSVMRKSNVLPNSFHRFAFTLIFSEKGVERMEYYNIENAEILLRQIVCKSERLPWAQSVSERGGVYCATDGYRAAAMLPQGTDDWDLSDAYFLTGDTGNPKFELSQIFDHRHGAAMTFSLSKEQAALLLVSFSLPTAQQKAVVCLDMNTLGVITQSEAHEPAMAFHVRYIEEPLKFCMCSGEETIDIYYTGRLNPLLMKSGRLYAAVLPVLIRDE